jgi:hypothetical protein
MKNSLRSICLVCFLFALNFCSAQPVITEYFAMRESIKIDLNDKKIQKSINAKGLLDMVCNNSNSVLAVTYDPKMIDSKEILRVVQEVLGLNNTAIVSNPMSAK